MALCIGSQVPAGTTITWSERQSTLSVHVGATDPFDVCLEVSDQGNLLLHFKTHEGDKPTKIVLSLFKDVDAAKTSYSTCGRGISINLQKLAVGRWGQLVTGILKKKKACKECFQTCLLTHFLSYPWFVASQVQFQHVSRLIGRSMLMKMRKSSCARMLVDST